MKIVYKKGDLLQCEEKIIVHGCNAQGVMGAGVAKLIKKDCPSLAKEYFKWCKSCINLLGCILWYDCHNGNRLKGKIVGNAVTQEFYGRRGKYVSYEAVRRVMQTINIANLGDSNIIAMPKIGAGLAGGDWNIISQIIEEESSNFQPVVYEL